MFGAHKNRSGNPLQIKSDRIFSSSLSSSRSEMLNQFWKVLIRLLETNHHQHLHTISLGKLLFESNETFGLEKNFFFETLTFGGFLMWVPTWNFWNIFRVSDWSSIDIVLLANIYIFWGWVSFVCCVPFICVLISQMSIQR